ADENAREKDAFATQRVAYAEIIADQEKQIAWLTERVKAYEDLLKKEAVTKTQVLDAQVRVENIRHEMSQSMVELRRVDITAMQSQERRRQAELEKVNQIRAAEDQL